MIDDRYRTIGTEGHAQLREKASRFIARAMPVCNEEEIKEALASIAREHHTSRHVCYAWVLGEDGEQHRNNDAGEPSGTAGRPILQRIRSLQLTYCMVVVVRYFGGTKLGKAGLIRAYGEAAALALANASMEERMILVPVSMTCGYAQVEMVRREVLEEHGEIRESTFGESCELVIALPRSRVEVILENWSGRGITAAYDTRSK